MGDSSSDELRKNYFDKIDVDGSNSIDFEEFNEVRYKFDILTSSKFLVLQSTPNPWTVLHLKMVTSLHLP